MVISMLDQMLFPLSCGHNVDLQRLQGAVKWICDECSKQTDLTGAVRAALVKDLDTALQIDIQAKERGHQIERLG